MDNVTLEAGNWATSHTGKEFCSNIGNGDLLYNWVTNTTCSSFTFCQLSELANIYSNSRCYIFSVTRRSRSDECYLLSEWAFALT